MLDEIAAVNELKLQIAVSINVGQTLVHRNVCVPQSRQVSDMSPAASAGAATAGALAQTAIVISILFIAVLLERKGGILKG